MTGNDLNNDRNYDPTTLMLLTATAVWLAGQLTHDPDSAKQFADIFLPLFPRLLERR
ncbi:hypothetical protein HZZ00_37990 (plasmid) [Streptomyces sp. NEAU-sy36]|uniref:hypothetical protein n=1 Tax=unclassified Streptomyces TaxID=2593676 RepID=UPI0015D62E06|nr:MULTISPECIES: hypothetical protein [unclassified Streptomyces]QLJ06823.1 hypothetical protein HZZ00_37990 [Streptomyces sp. NEAU-sy36]